MKGTIFENLRIKLVVLTIAALFWFAVVTENDFTHDVEVPIRVTNLPPAKTLVSKLPTHATVRFEGKGRALLGLLFYRDAHLELDLGSHSLNGELELRQSMVHFRRRGMAVTATQVVAPRVVFIRLAALQKKVVPVTPAVAIIPQPGFTQVGEVSVRPDTVTLTGPEEYVRRLHAVSTVTQQFPNLRTSLRQIVPLQRFPDSMHIALSRTQVEVFAGVQKLIELTIQEVPVRVRNVPPGYVATPVPSTLSITLEGGEQFLMNLKREEIVAYIDFSRMRGDQAEGHRAYIEVPEGVRYRNVKPVLFKLMMERENHGSTRH